MLRYRQRSPKNDQGFTVIELIVVIAVFGISMITISQLFAAVQIAQRNSRYVDLALQVARAEIEWRQATGAISGTTFNVPSWPPAGLPVSSYTITPDAASKKVTITVRYSLGSTTKSVIVTGLVDPEGV